MRIIATIAFLCLPATAFGQDHAGHVTATGRHFRLGAQAIGLVTHATPAEHGKALTESYLTQPNLFAHAQAGAFAAMVTINLEGLTLENGELNAGTWGEGFVDKRHPHTYLHEAMASVEGTVLGSRLSLAAGKGFASFGSDDPMVRPLVKFPANHHLGQVLERLVVVGAARRGPVLIEGTLFNGDEPIDSKSNGTIDRVGDSWAARVTLFPRHGYELQASYAAINSPEQHDATGLDQEKWSVALRHERETGAHPHYFLVEWLRTGELSDGEEVVGLDSWLAEGSVSQGAWKAAGRLERTLRPEEERAGSIFRSPWPHIDQHIFGLTRWFIVSANVSRSVNLGALRVVPIIELSHQRPTPEVEPVLFEPEQLYGSDRLWSFSIGVRIGAGAAHKRMGRYGVALAPTTH